MDELWDRVRSGRHAAVVGLAPGEPSPALGMRVVRVRCDGRSRARSGPCTTRAAASRPSSAPRRRGSVEVRDRMVSGLRRRLLGDVPSFKAEGALVAASTASRRRRTGPRPWSSRPWTPRTRPRSPRSAASSGARAGSSCRWCSASASPIPRSSRAPRSRSSRSSARPVETRRSSAARRRPEGRRRPPWIPRPWSGRCAAGGRARAARGRHRGIGLRGQPRRGAARARGARRALDLVQRAADGRSTSRTRARVACTCPSPCSTRCAPPPCPRS